MRRRPSAATRDALHANRNERRRIALTVIFCGGATVFCFLRLLFGLYRGAIVPLVKGADWTVSVSDQPLLFGFFALIYVVLALVFGWLTTFIARLHFIQREDHDPAPTIPTNFSNK